MIDKKTVFVLGAGASCPYGYPSGAYLHKRVCLSQGLFQDYNACNLSDFSEYLKKDKLQRIKEFKYAFDKSGIKSIDKFMVHNPKLAPIGKYIIAFEILRAEGKSIFGEEAKFEQEQIAYLKNNGMRSPSDLLPQPLLQGDDWYSYLYNRLIEGREGKDALPDFSNGSLTFITFNYDRSLEYFLYEALRNSFTEASEDRIIQSLKQMKVLHVYNQIAPLKWQNPKDYIDYRLPINESLLERAANNIRTIHEEKQNPELTEAQKLLRHAERIFFLGFGYAQENMAVLGLPGIIPHKCWVYGTAFGAEDKEIDDIRKRIILGLEPDVTMDKNEERVEIKNMDCLKLLRNCL